MFLSALMERGSSLFSPGELAAMYEVLSIGRHELGDEHGAARMHAGSQELHHVHIPAILQDGNLHQKSTASACVQSPSFLLFMRTGIAPPYMLTHHLGCLKMHRQTFRIHES